MIKSELSIYKLKLGDKKTFRCLFNEFYPRLCCFAYKYVQDDQASEDIVQGILSDLWDKRQFIDIQTSLNAFLYTSVKNRCINQLNKKASDERRLIEYMELTSNSIGDYNYIEEEVHANLYEAINDLPAKSKEVVLLSMREMSNVEIKDQLNISINTVKSNKKRAYRLLRKKLR